MIVYQCEDSLEGIFTAIYNAYEEKRNHQDTRLMLTDEPLLFAEYIPVTADTQKALKVIRTLKRQFGEDDYLTLCYALSSSSDDKAQAVYRTIVEGLSQRCAKGHLFDRLNNDDINLCFTLSRAASNERQHLCQFIRFQELENGVLYVKVGPKNNLLTFVMPHFADRFPMENFMIYDDKRDLFALHPAGQQWWLKQGRELLSENGFFKFSEQEQKYQELFRHFCHKIAIKERQNLQLQRNMMPLRFQEYMIDFNKKCQNGGLRI